MGNKASKDAGTTSETIEEWYAARAAECKAGNRLNAEVQHEDGANGNVSDVVVEPDHATEDDVAPNDTNSGTNCASSPEEDKVRANLSLVNMRTFNAVRDTVVPTNALKAATIYLAIAIRAFGMKIRNAFDTALTALKSIDVAAVAEAALKFMKAHPWEIAAIAIPLILLACTPAILAAAGFTAGGIAAGSVAAGVQAGIGNVAAGSAFAILTSAGMGGYGVPIVLGGTWAISSAVGWGVAAWKSWRGGDGNGDSGERNFPGSDNE